MMQAHALEGGFANPSLDAARAFRAALDVMARPGLIATIEGARPPAPLSPAAGALVLVLTDRTTPVHLAPSHDVPVLRDWITFQTGAPLVAADDAMFAIGAWAALAPVSRFAIGTPEYPDRAATLIVELASLAASGARLTGPGIEVESALNLPETAAFSANRARFPLGWDCFFTAGAQLAGLPRSTRVEAG